MAATSADQPFEPLGETCSKDPSIQIVQQFVERDLLSPSATIFIIVKRTWKNPCFPDARFGLLFGLLKRQLRAVFVSTDGRHILSRGDLTSSNAWKNAVETNSVDRC